MNDRRSDEVEETLRVIRLAAGAFPDLRLCQLIVNATGKNDPFYVTDEKLRHDLQAYMTLSGVRNA